jgi:hypothetical protein
MMMSLFLFSAMVGGVLNGPVAPDEGDLTRGTWELNLAESVPPQGTVFRPFNVTIYQAGAMLAFTQTEIGPDGKTRSFSHQTPTDGVERPVPEFPGAKMTMTRLPSGVIDAKLRFPNGALQNKVCLLQPDLNKQVCFATITSATGEVKFFKHVLNRIK